MVKRLCKLLWKSIQMMPLLYHKEDQHHIDTLQQGYRQYQLLYPCLLLYSPKGQNRSEHVVSLCLVIQMEVYRVTNPNIKNQGEVLVDRVFRCILSEANPDPVDVVQKVFRKPGHAVSCVYLSTLPVRTTNRENGGQFIHCLYCHQVCPTLMEQHIELPQYFYFKFMKG